MRGRAATLLFPFCLVLLALSAHGQQDTLWFADDWSATSREQASFFRPWPKKTADGYLIRDFYRSGFLQMEGGFRDADATIRHGAFTYYNDGSPTILNREHYRDNKPAGDWISYDTTSGKPISKTTYAEDTSVRAMEYYYPDGRVESAGIMRHNGRNGEWKGYYQDSRLAWTMDFDAGTMHGESVKYDSATRAVIARGEKIHGVEKGVYAQYKPGKELPFKTVTFDPKDASRAVMRMYDTISGALRSEMELYAHKRHGKATTYYADGKVKTTITYVADKMEGLAQRFSQTGKLVATGNFAAHERNGDWKFFNDDGALQSVLHYNADLLDGSATYYDAGTRKVKSTGQHANGKREGKWEYFVYGTPRVSNVENYKEGKLHGPMIVYNRKGQVVLEGQNEEGRGVGKWKYYKSSTGQMFLEKYYVRGRLHGVINAYAPDRSLIRTETYTNGKLESQRCLGAKGIDTNCSLRSQPVRYDTTYQQAFDKARKSSVDDLLKESPDTVVVRVTVGIEGNVFWPTVLRSTNSELNDEAERLATTLKVYTPATELGEPVSADVSLPIIFAARRRR